LNEYEQERYRSGKRLHEEDRSFGRQRADDAGDDDAREEKDADRERVGPGEQSPDQACCEEGVVEALIGRQGFRAFRELAGEPEDAPARGLRLEKRLQDEKAEVKNGDDPDGDAG